MHQAHCSHVSSSPGYLPAGQRPCHDRYCCITLRSDPKRPALLCLRKLFTNSRASALLCARCEYFQTKGRYGWALGCQLLSRLVAGAHFCRTIFDLCRGTVAQLQPSCCPPSLQVSREATPLVRRGPFGVVTPAKPILRGKSPGSIKLHSKGVSFNLRSRRAGASYSSPEALALAAEAEARKRSASAAAGDASGSPTASASGEAAASGTPAAAVRQPGHLVKLTPEQILAAAKGNYTPDMTSPEPQPQQYPGVRPTALGFGGATMAPADPPSTSDAAGAAPPRLPQQQQQQRVFALPVPGREGGAAPRPQLSLPPRPPPAQFSDAPWRPPVQHQPAMHPPGAFAFASMSARVPDSALQSPDSQAGGWAHSRPPPPPQGFARSPAQPDPSSVMSTPAHPPQFLHSQPPPHHQGMPPAGGPLPWAFPPQAPSAAASPIQLPAPMQQNRGPMVPAAQQFSPGPAHSYPQPQQQFQPPRASPIGPPPQAPQAPPAWSGYNNNPGSFMQSSGPHGPPPPHQQQQQGGSPYHSSLAAGPQPVAPTQSAAVPFVHQAPPVAVEAYGRPMPQAQPPFYPPYASQGQPPAHLQASPSRSSSAPAYPPPHPSQSPQQPIQLQPPAAAAPHGGGGAAATPWRAGLLSAPSFEDVHLMLSTLQLPSLAGAAAPAARPPQAPSGGGQFGLEGIQSIVDQLQGIFGGQNRQQQQQPPSQVSLA